ncbi:hypothetical protein A0J57_05395 [Sphingobium sp. 22B]|uniref:hypothetical protein n=1 Tax=unclassified Sphingobium TaxID=2611147 RepID=UPI00078021D4|nr:MULTISPECIES: hypothetical protein [unclassified Sphingobium]KXU31549.1 hypothetical protein AXW74_11855 [Sphingobium sp. AM]KYC33543.1 hypothetical protein A0J57_05395 [Sphingobium sp. 22B]OAP32724.1 hypothetical protein A8O16_07515 [Sphingobium sp. 20006FA]
MLLDNTPLPQSPFDVRPQAYGTPGIGDGLPQNQPFVWAEGGRRLTPEQLLAEQEDARARMAAGADYSPVQHWTQGLARLADGFIGGLEERQARKAAEANTAESGRVMQALLDPLASGTGTGDAQSAIIAALTNPYVSDEVRAVAGKMWDRDYEQNKPQYFMSGNNRVGFDPRTGESTVIYEGQSDAEDYAASLGFQPGTPEFSAAMQDFVLRGNGPTAFGFDTDLEGVRQDNRKEIEGVRQRNRLALRQTPTYANLHPQPAGGSGGGNRGGPPRSTGQVYAPIFAKVARGEPLTPGEQQIFNLYGRGSRGTGGKSAGSASGGGNPVATDGKGNKVQYDPASKTWKPVR